jgi:hypothetical protein
MKSSRIQTLLS